MDASSKSGSARPPHTSPGSPASSSESVAGARKFPIRLVSIVAILILALIFIFSNLEQWTLYFLGFEFTGAAWMWFLVLLFAGVAIGLLIPRFGNKSKKQ